MPKRKVDVSTATNVEQGSYDVCYVTGGGIDFIKNPPMPKRKAYRETTVRYPSITKPKGKAKAVRLKVDATKVKAKKGRTRYPDA